MKISNPANIIEMIRCIELLLEVCESQQDLLCDLADNYGISVGPTDSDKLEMVRKRIQFLTPWRRSTEVERIG